MRRVITSVALALGLGLAAWQAPAAFGADSVYWSDNADAIQVGNLNGGGTAQTVFTGESGAEGVAIDPKAGKIYWADSTGTIRVGNLNGSGSPQTLFSGETMPVGVAIDPSAGKIYWTDEGVGVGSGAIRVGNLNGSGSAQTLFSGENSPSGVALDLSAETIYWADNANPGTIRAGSLGGGSARTLFSGEGFPFGVGIDAAAGKIYWANDLGAIRVGNLDGLGVPQDLFTGENEPFAVAIDPGLGKIYWTAGTAIRVGNLNGSGAAQNLIADATDTRLLVLLQSPLGTATPQVTGGSSVGSTVSCGGAQWAPDLTAALLYRAPQNFSYQWFRDGGAIAGATSGSYTASAPGSYTCGVTALNQAGSTSQISAAHAVSAAPLQLTNASESHRRWREGSKLPVIARVRTPSGTTLRFSVNEAARVQFRFTQRLSGRRVGSRCVKPTSKNSHKRKCARTLTRGTLSFSAGSGAHKVRFDGRLSKHKKLPAGRYMLIITATNAVGQTATAKLTFTIVRG